MKILIVENDSDIREVLIFMLESHLDAEVLEAESGNRAISILTENEDIDLIISDYEMPNGSGWDVYKYLQSSRRPIPFILCTSSPPDNHSEFTGQTLAGTLSMPFPVEELLKIIKEIQFKAITSPPIPESMPGFCRIRISSLMRMSALACDLYLKLGAEKYIKVANSNECFDEDDFDRFRGKGLQFLYLPRESVDLFLSKLTREILTLKKAKARPPIEALQLSGKIQTIVHELNSTLGFTREVQELIKSNVQLALTTMNNHQRLKELLGAMFVSKTNYICPHSIALAHVAGGLAAQMNWQTQSSLYKLALAAFLHDITLQNEELAQVHTEEALISHSQLKKRFSTTEVEQFMKHPQAAAFMVSQMEEIPPDVDSIIAQHHELPDGKGFPSHINYTKIFPLSCIFIIAHDIVSEYWTLGSAFHIEDFLIRNEPRYRFGYFKKIAAVIALNHLPSKG